MKKIIPLFISILFGATLMAQTKKGPFPDNTYVNGSKMETTGGKNVNGEREDYIEYYDAGRNKKQMKTVTYKENGDSVITNVTYDCYGGQTSKREVRKDKNGKQYSDTYEQYDEKTRAVTDGYRRITENGETKTYLYNTFREEYEPISSLPPDAFPDIKTDGVCCKQRQSVYIDYSFLTDTEEDSEAIPLGVHLAYTYLLTGRFGIVGDMSLHSKKDRELRITRAFLLGGIQYYILQQQDKRMKALARLLGGLTTDKQKYTYNGSSNTNKATAFAIAFGLGLEYQVNRRVAACVLADYILSRFNQEWQGAIRASAGVKINIGCK